jgi:quercetin dioxygenase-like cupin family protein
MASPNNVDLVSPLRTPIVYITTHNTAGHATVHSSNKEEVSAYPGMRVSHKLVYTTLGFPVEINDEFDIKDHQEVVSSGFASIVRENGSVCRIVDFAPHNKSMMHRTQSLDVGIVLEGSVVMELDDGSATVLSRGDVVVQRGTMHSWKNASESEWARMAFVLQDCKPLLVSGERFKEDLGVGNTIFSKSGNDADA